MNTEMPKTYDPASVEHAWYEKWERNGYFHAAPNPDKTPFTIVIPPPNITGKLHMGHIIFLQKRNKKTATKSRR